MERCKLSLLGHHYLPKAFSICGNQSSKSRIPNVQGQNKIKKDTSAWYVMPLESNCLFILLSAIAECAYTLDHSNFTTTLAMHCPGVTPPPSFATRSTKHVDGLGLFNW